MQTLPSTELKTWVLVPAKKEWDAIYITTLQMEAISKAWKNNVMAELRNKEGHLVEVLYRTDWRPRPIKIDQDEVKNRGGRRWICDYGTRHEMHIGVTEENGVKQWNATCPCPEKFKCSYADLILWCRRQYPTRGVDHPHQIKAYMQDEFLRLVTLASK